MQGMVPLCGFGGVPYSAVRKAAPRNLLDNSDFTNLVAQAGIGGNHGTIAYAADRWILDSGTVSYEAGVGLTLNGTIRQKLEFPPTEETSAFVGMASGAASISYADGEVTITSGGGVIKWAALYGGVYTETTKPEYQPKGYGAELAECQRYYYKHNASTALIAGCLFNTGVVRVGYILPVPMIKTPSVDVSDTSFDSIDIYATSKVTTHPTSISVHAFTEDSTFLSLSLSWSFSATAGTAANVRFNTSFSLIADL